jgi:hypothetical protein
MPQAMVVGRLPPTYTDLTPLRSAMLPAGVYLDGTPPLLGWQPSFNLAFARRVAAVVQQFSGPALLPSTPTPWIASDLPFVIVRPSFAAQRELLALIPQPMPAPVPPAPPVDQGGGGDEPRKKPIKPIWDRPKPPQKAASVTEETPEKSAKPASAPSRKAASVTEEIRRISLPGLEAILNPAEPIQALSEEEELIIQLILQGVI